LATHGRSLAVLSLVVEEVWFGRSWSTSFRTGKSIIRIRRAASRRLDKKELT